MFLTVQLFLYEILRWIRYISDCEGVWHLKDERKHFKFFHIWACLLLGPGFPKTVLSLLSRTSIRSLFVHLLAFRSNSVGCNISPAPLILDPDYAYSGRFQRTLCRRSYCKNFCYLKMGDLNSRSILHSLEHCVLQRLSTLFPRIDDTMQYFPCIFD